MNILILMGSPRLQCNTAELCKPFMAELEALGAEVRYTALAEKQIAPCKAFDQIISNCGNIGSAE